MNTTDTPTPRTEAAEIKMYSAKPAYGEIKLTGETAYVLADFARTLERELAQALRSNEFANFQRQVARVNDAEARATRAEAELAALKGPSSFLVSPEFMQQHLALEKDNAALRAALTQIAEWKDDTGAWLYTEEAIQIARAALAKEGGR